MGRGKIIIFEGIDGSGKTTVAKRLTSQLLRDRIIPAIETSEPTDGPIGKLIRKYLSGEYKLYDKSTIQILNMADRLEHLSGEIMKVYNTRTAAIVDRFMLSTVAYGLAESDDFSISKAYDLYQSSEKLLYDYQIRKNDLITIYLRCNPEVAMKRLQSRSGEKEIYENNETLSRVYHAYDLAIDVWDRVSPYPYVIDINANRDEEGVYLDVFSKVKEIIGGGMFDEDY